MHVLDICEFEEVWIKTEGTFPIISLWDLFVAMVITVLIRSVQNLWSQSLNPTLLLIKFEEDFPTGLRDNSV